MPRLIAIDMGSHAVKVTTWRGTGRQYDLEERHLQPVPQDGDLPGLELRLAALDALIDDVPTLRSQGNDIVVLALPSSDATFRRVPMPFTDPRQIADTLEFQVENEVPFDLDEMVLGWRIAEVSAQTQVMAVLARHTKVSEWVSALAERQLDPAAVHVDGDLFGPWGALVDSPEPVLVNAEDALQPTDAPSRQLVAVVDVGHLHTVVSVVRDGTVQLCRSVNVGGHAFTRAIQSSLNIEWSEAEQLKHGGAEVEVSPDDEITDSGARRHSGYGQLPQAARQAVDGAIGLLLAEVRSTLIKAEDSLGGEIVELRLTGGSARIDELWDYLAQDLGVSVKRAIDPTGERVPAPFAVSQALAYTAIGAQAGAVDLRVGDLAFRGGTDMVRAVLTYGLAGGVFFTLAAVVMFAFQYRSLAVEQSTTEAMITQLVVETFPDIPPGEIDSGTKAVALMAANTEEAVQQAERLGTGASTLPPTIDMLYQLTSAFPDPSEVSVELDDLSITPTNISFDAETDGGSAAAAAVEEALKATEAFAAAEKGEENRVGATKVKFPVNIPLGEAADAETTEEEG